MSRPPGIFARIAVGFVLFGGRGSCQRPPSSPSSEPPVPRQIFEVDSARQRPLVIIYNPSTPQAIPPDSRLTIFDDGEIQYRVSTWQLCSSEDAKNCPDPSWPFRWDDSQEHVLQGKVDVSELDHLKKLLDRDDVKRIEGYDNAGPTVGDFRISINRANRRQLIVVVGFNPRYGWENPALTDLICTAKVIANISKSDALPSWCNTHPPK
jgi:hypothetical protein